MNSDVGLAILLQAKRAAAEGREVKRLDRRAPQDSTEFGRRRRMSCEKTSKRISTALLSMLLQAKRAASAASAVNRLDRRAPQDSTEFGRRRRMVLKGTFKRISTALVSMLLSTTMVACASTQSSKTCVADRGCPTAVQPPPCTSAEEALSVATAREQEEQLEGQIVTLRGFLTRAGNECTRLGCLKDACCNRCEGHLAIADEPSVQLSSPLPPHVLIGEKNAAQSRCVGDDTGQCCHYAIDGTIVFVSGTIAADPSTAAGARITSKSICTSK